jgi:RHS repeat-associated protein
MTAEDIRSTGKERDAESGLDYFEARHFGSALGRFTSPDPDEK